MRSIDGGTSEAQTFAHHIKCHLALIGDPCKSRVMGEFMRVGWVGCIQIAHSHGVIEP